jgi:hypothetical protein
VCEIIQQNMLGGQAKTRTQFCMLRKMVNSFLWFFCLGQPMPPASLDLNLPLDPLGGDMPANQEDNVKGDWDQWIENI